MSDFVNNLPRYLVTRSKDVPGFLVVYCGRKDCPGGAAGRPFLVAEREWLRPLRYTNKVKNETFVITGRSCPYCFKAGRIPMRREIG